MSQIHKTIVINAPVAKVHSYMKDPANLPEYWPAMLEVRNIRKNAKGLPIYEWVYKMAGIKFEGETDTLEVIDNVRTVTQSTKGIPSHFIFDYLEKDGKTEMSVTVEYTAPNTLLGKLAQGMVDRLNEHDADAMLTTLKARMEA